MKYKFHAGDYIETKDNKSGYITIFIQNYDGENTSSSVLASMILLRKMKVRLKR